MSKRGRKLKLTATLRDVDEAIRKGWYRDKKLCQMYFDECEDRALLSRGRALWMARRAVELAELNGNPHLVNHAHGVLVHGYIARRELFWAHKTLKSYIPLVQDCCRRCRSDFLRRCGDYFGERKLAIHSLIMLAWSLEEGKGLLSRDKRARVAFVRGIAWHQAGNPDRALADAGQVLRELSLRSPQPLFLDTLALVAIYVGSGERRHDETALELFERFRKRVRGNRGWRAALTRMAWSEGHVHARLGDMRRARERLELAHGDLLKSGLAREAVASAIDLAQLRCRHKEPRDDNVRSARLVIKRCLDKRKDLRRDHRKGLQSAARVLARYPNRAFDELLAFRQSFTAPVPGVLGEALALERAAEEEEEKAEE